MGGEFLLCIRSDAAVSSAEHLVSLNCKNSSDMPD